MRIPRAALVAVAVAALAAPCSAPCSAQATGTSAADSVFRRAQRLASDGNTAAGRALADSVLAASPEGSPPYVDALYWRAMLSDSADQARRDYLRIALEFSLSPRAEDALLRLAQLELARGDRAAAKKHLERLALEHATGTSRAQGSYWMGRVLLDEGALAPACASLAEAKSRVAGRDVELANQIGYYARPCMAVQHAADSARTDSMARADSVVRADSAARADSAEKKARTATAGAPRDGKRTETKHPGWSVQVAAYAMKADADRLARRLGARGYDARVTTERPYRVRIGRFSKREDALQLALRLKAAQTSAIVVEAEKP
jgi:cell division septation protein DedD